MGDQAHGGVAPGIAGRRAAGRGLTVVALTILAALTLLATLTLLTGMAEPAGAHAALTTTSPEDGAEVSADLDEIVLTFTEPMQPPATVEVADPNGDPVGDADAKIDGDRVRLDVESLTVDGTYSVAWRVVSADDHPIEGEFSFDVAGAEDDEGDGDADDGSASGDEGESGSSGDTTDADADDAGGDENADGVPSGDDESATDDGEADDEALASAGDSAASHPGEGDGAGGVLPWLLGGAVVAALGATAAAVVAQRRRSS